MMLPALFLVWLQMSAQPVTRVTMYESMCRRPMVEYGGRYQVIVGAGECFIFERNIGEVYWSGPHGQAILFPIGSPLDDITRAEFAEAAQRSADETDGKPHQNMPPLPPSGSMECWNDAQTSDYLCQDSKGRTVDVTKAMLRLMDEVDVPAVQVGSHLGFEGCGTAICIDHPVADYSCKDKSRILERDENSPPKYWCHKVQP